MCRLGVATVAVISMSVEDLKVIVTIVTIVMTFCGSYVFDYNCLSKYKIRVKIVKIFKIAKSVEIVEISEISTIMSDEKTVNRLKRTKICIIKSCEYSKGTRLPIRMYR